jgi:hypothetical protein
LRQRHVTEKAKQGGQPCPQLFSFRPCPDSITKSRMCINTKTPAPTLASMPSPCPSHFPSFTPSALPSLLPSKSPTLLPTALATADHHASPPSASAAKWAAWCKRFCVTVIHDMMPLPLGVFMSHF